MSSSMTASLWNLYALCPSLLPIYVKDTKLTQNGRCSLGQDSCPVLSDASEGARVAGEEEERFGLEQA